VDAGEEEAVPRGQAATTVEAELAQWKDTALRARADLDNFRKRMAQESADAGGLVDAVVAHARDHDDEGLLGQIVDAVRLHPLLQYEGDGTLMAAYERRFGLPVAAGNASGEIGVDGRRRFGHRIQTVGHAEASQA